MLKLSLEMRIPGGTVGASAVREHTGCLNTTQPLKVKTKHEDPGYAASLNPEDNVPGHFQAKPSDEASRSQGFV